MYEVKPTIVIALGVLVIVIAVIRTGVVSFCWERVQEALERKLTED